MDIVRLKGGLGNQMFQYAFMEALKKRGRQVKVSLGWYRKTAHAREFLLDKVFPGICLEYVADEIFDENDARWNKIKQDKTGLQAFCDHYEERFFWVEDVWKEPCTYHPQIFQTRNCVFVGYWQSEKYFKDIRERLLGAFRFAASDTDLVKFGDRLNKDGYVSVHVRRGDYLFNPDVYAGVCTQEYYLRAMDCIKEKAGNDNWIFFSDDMAWVRENLYVPNAVYFDKSMFDRYQDWYDMYFMSRCRHNIIANSTFSWWGAWLNQSADKIVIAPRRWHKNNETPDIWCEEWIRL